MLQILFLFKNVKKTLLEKQEKLNETIALYFCVDEQPIVFSMRMCFFHTDSLAAKPKLHF